MLSKAVTYSATRQVAMVLRRPAMLNRLTLQPTVSPHVRTMSILRPAAVPMSNSVILKRLISTTQPQSHEHKVCWKCNHVVPQIDLHCSNDDCGVIQNTSQDINFFEALEAGLGENA
jgi:hypothetical protein